MTPAWLSGPAPPASTGARVGRGWIYSIARNLALNAVRDGAREVEMDDDTAAALDARASLEAWHDAADAFAWRDSAGRIGPCLEQLEPVRRNRILHAPRGRPVPRRDRPAAGGAAGHREGLDPSAVWPPAGVHRMSTTSPATCPRHPRAGRRIRAGHRSAPAGGRSRRGSPMICSCRPPSWPGKTGCRPHRPGRAGGAVAAAVGAHRAQPRRAGHAGLQPSVGRHRAGPGGAGTAWPCGVASPPAALRSPRCWRRCWSAASPSRPAEARFMVVLVAPTTRRRAGWCRPARPAPARWS